MRTESELLALEAHLAKRSWSSLWPRTTDTRAVRAKKRTQAMELLELKLVELDSFGSEAAPEVHESAEGGDIAEVAEIGTTATTGTTATIGSSSSIKSASPSIALQTSTVFWRTLTDVWRNKSLLLLHVCIAIAAGLIMGGLFFELGYDTQGVQVGIDHD